MTMPRSMLCVAEAVRESARQYRVCGGEVCEVRKVRKVRKVREDLTGRRGLVSVW